MKIAPEHQSVEAFVSYCMDDECYEFRPGDAQKIAAVIRRPIPAVIQELKSYGLSCLLPEAEKSVRGFSSNPNGTFPFSGANSTFTTPGGDSIIGFAGRRGS